MGQKLWYDAPAQNWNEALPIGNGRLGAMIYGKPEEEIIQVNEDSVWSGGLLNRNNMETLPNLQKMRDLVNDGKLSEAQDLALHAFSGQPDNERCYQTAGVINISTGHTDVTNYYRELDIANAIVRVSYDYKGTKFTREIISSNPADIIAMRFRSEGELPINLNIFLDRFYFIDRLYCEDNNSVIMEYDGGINFSNKLAATCVGGAVSTQGGHLLVRGAKEVTLYFDSETAYRHEDYKAALRAKLARNLDRSFDTLYEEHVKDYQRYFSRTSLHFEGKAKADMPMNVRLATLTEDETDTDLIETYYNFGRYLLISSSRVGTLPANLQGIWNEKMTPSWGSKFTININAEMNYWFAEQQNLSELHMPLMELLKKVHKNGKITASRMYGCRGFCAHHNTDIWGDSAPQDYWLPGSYWVLGGAWLCLHAWEHYNYTRDDAFLKEFFPIIEDACLFLTDFLSKDKQGRYVLIPTASPENCYRLPNGEIGYLCAGCTMDQQIMRELFADYDQACEALHTHTELQDTIHKMLPDMPETTIHSNGTIREWNDEYEEIELGHRHISHLFGLYPGHQITPEATPELAEAARKTLIRRISNGGGHTGWSRAWIINFWARLGDSKETLYNIKQLLIKSCLPNLFDNHPPFQIDGNFGGVAGLCEMLLQFRHNTLYLLPALPEELGTGSFTGFKPCHDLLVDMSFKDGKPEVVTFHATAPMTITVSFGGKEREVVLECGDTKVKF